MFSSLLTIAWRNIIKRKGYALLNISGLCIGMACCLLIFEYVSYERSYDTFHDNATRVYRIQDEEYQSGRMVVPCASAMPAVAPTMKRDFPEVENACRLVKNNFLLANDLLNIKFTEDNIYYADQAVLDIFHLPLQRGDIKTALTGPGKIIISGEEAKKYFGAEDAIGKILNIHSNGRIKPLEVTGVFKDYPANSHLKFSLIISYPTYSQAVGAYGRADDPTETSWSWTDFYTYVKLRPGTDPKKLAAKLPAFIDKYYNSLPENKNNKDRYNLSMMPLENIHLYSHYTEEAEVNGDGQAVSFLFLIAFFIIGIAWINYINLATARSLERAREVGVRKVLGATRKQLVRQFMMESLLMNMMALMAALAITFLVNPFFNEVTGQPQGSLYSLPGIYWISFALLFLAGTVLSGLYPAFVLSRYNPVIVLKGLFKNAAGGQWIRKALIVTQFGASIILITGTMIIYQQVHYMRSQQPGADIGQTLVLKGASAGVADSAYHDIFQAFRDDILQVNGVKSITASSNVMGQEILWSTDWKKLGSTKIHPVNLFHLGVDENFISSYNLKLVAGRAFSKEFASDKKAVVLNESAVKELNYASPQAAIGELISGGQQSMDSMHIVGVIADYHNEGLQKAIQPLVLLPGRDRRLFYSIKVHETGVANTIAAIKNSWNKHFPGDPYSYFFLDEFFDRQYAANERFGVVFGFFASLTIMIACFGLLGLSAYNVLQRTKEIGIRKVLGASVQSLLYILSRDFMMLVGIAFLIAIPVTWIVMNEWLQGFAYRISISWRVFAAAGTLCVLFALSIISCQALKATMANPIKSLRTE